MRRADLRFAHVRHSRRQYQLVPVLLGKAFLPFVKIMPHIKSNVIDLAAELRFPELIEEPTCMPLLRQILLTVGFQSNGELAASKQCSSEGTLFRKSTLASICGPRRIW